MLRNSGQLSVVSYQRTAFGLGRAVFSRWNRARCHAAVTSVAVSLAAFVMLTILWSATVYAGHLEPFKSVPIPKNNPQTPEKIELGRKLFFDRRLSGDGTTSCATCHVPEQGYADGQDISQSYPTTKNWRNAQTLINVAFYKSFFHDGRVQTLEDQALFPMMSAFEMNQNLDFVEEEIRTVPAYAEAFEKVFGGEPNRKRIAMALASFERTLISVNAPYDRFLKGETHSLSEDAREGFEIFRGKGKCSECHDGVNLSDDKFYALNVPENPVLLNDPRVTATMRFVAKVYHYPGYRNLKDDPGRFLITKDRKDWKAFRTAGLREIARTAPYMHNGIFITLDEVIEFFDQGGGNGNRFLKPLGLSAAEKKQLKVFLVEALSGEDLKITYPEVP
ncbi:MAG: cytochrome-c peroxidase [Nitrospirae bacterium]|nr:cytochrome-c peroxidase [Nitrospirota bacterium]